MSDKSLPKHVLMIYLSSLLYVIFAACEMVCLQQQFYWGIADSYDIYSFQYRADGSTHYEGDYAYEKHICCFSGNVQRCRHFPGKPVRWFSGLHSGILFQCSGGVNTLIKNQYTPGISENAFPFRI